MIITACKRSLGQGNVFTCMCHSVRGWGVGFPACITGHMTGVSQSGGGWADPFAGNRKVSSTNPTGMLSRFFLPWLLIALLIKTCVTVYSPSSGSSFGCLKPMTKLLARSTLDY